MELQSIFCFDRIGQKEVISLKKLTVLLLALSMVFSAASCAKTEQESPLPSSAISAVSPAEPSETLEASTPEDSILTEKADTPYQPTEDELTERAAIESALNLKNNPEQAWSYSSGAWILSPVAAVTAPELPEQQGVSVCVPGAYVTGIDTDGDGMADVTAENAVDTVFGSLVIDYEAQIVSSGGQIYTAATAPTVFTTGAAGYGSQNNSSASTLYAAEGYISMTCGNRGKQDTVTDEEGNVLYYTGDAPSCLVDQKAAARFVKYNMLLGNLPGNVDYFVSTGGSGGGAHAAMFAATSNHPDFYDYQIEAGAVGVYRNSDGSYTTGVTIDGELIDLQDGAWGCIAYSPITSLYEGDMAQAFEYYIDTTYSFNTEFQAQLASYLSESYMQYINEKQYTLEEQVWGIDLNGDGDMEDEIPLTIEYDPEAHPETNGYYGTYLNLYHQIFTQNLQNYLDNLSYSEGWTWFDENGQPLTHEAVSAMTDEDRAAAFLEGRYTKASSGGMGPDGMGGPPGALPMGDPPGDLPLDLFGDNIRDGGPMMGSTASASGGGDSSNYESFEALLEDYRKDIADISSGDRYGKNIVDLYNPLRYIGAEGTENPTWCRLVSGAVEGDISMFNSLNMKLSWCNAGVDTAIEWQWDGGHVPSEVLGDSLSLYLDKMYGIYVSGIETEKPPAEPQTENGDAEEMSGTDLSSWVSLESGRVSFTLEDVLKYRNSGATKAVPGFDVIDYGQEDYVFGSAQQDARHWNPVLLDIFETHADVLAPLFNQTS